MSTMENLVYTKNNKRYFRVSFSPSWWLVSEDGFVENSLELDELQPLEFSGYSDEKYPKISGELWEQRIYWEGVPEHQSYNYFVATHENKLVFVTGHGGFAVNIDSNMKIGEWHKVNLK